MSQEPPSPVEHIKQAENHQSPSFLIYIAHPRSSPDRLVKSAAKHSFVSYVQRYWGKERDDLQQTCPLFKNVVMGQNAENIHDQEPAVWIRGHEGLAVEYVHALTVPPNFLHWQLGEERVQFLEVNPV